MLISHRRDNGCVSLAVTISLQTLLRTAYFISYMPLNNQNNLSRAVNIKRIKITFNGSILILTVRSFPSNLLHCYPREQLSKQNSF